jgi:hypothetical protein
MKRFSMAAVALALGLGVGRAAADDIQWRPASPTSAQAPAVTLKAPVPVPAIPLQQTSYDAVVRAKQLNDVPPSPLPLGPAIPDRPENAPPPKNIQQAPVQQAPPAAMESWAPPVSTFSNGVHCGPPGDPIPAPCCDSGACPAGDCCTGGSWWSNCCLGRWCSSCGLDRWCSNLHLFDGCACNDGCCPSRPCIWGKAEYLLWTVKSAPMPPLVTANPNAGVPPVPGMAGTEVAFGGHSDGFNLRSGGKFTVGFGLPCLGDMGFETTYFFLADRSSGASFASNGVPGLGRPFRETGAVVFIAPTVPSPTNLQAELVALAGVVSGNVKVKTDNELWGLEANFRNLLTCGPNYRVDLLWGFRHLNLAEDLDITEDLTGLGGVLRGGSTSIGVSDRFLTRNQFYGGQVGLDGEYRFGRWFFGGTGKLAMGPMHQTVSIDGNTVFRDGANPGTESGGLLALSGTNIGRYNRDTFAIVPEAGLRVGFYFTEHWRAYVGYDVLYASSVVRPGDQIDLNVNSSYLPRNGPRAGPPLPQFTYRTSDFWGQGVCFGMELRY